MEIENQPKLKKINLNLILTCNIGINGIKTMSSPGLYRG